MTREFDHDLVLAEDIKFEESIEVDGNIRCKDGRWNLEVQGDIEARNIDVWNIDSCNINAWNIDADNIGALDIDADNIDAGNIDAGNIDARNISFYAFCIARGWIKCTGIEGRRENSIYEALDGEVEIKEKPKICECCGQEIPEEEK